MTEIKLTEAETMKVLECCSKKVAESCAECPLRETNCLDISIEQLAIDLINRKNAEIERVTKERDNIIKTYMEVVDAWKITRAEAIKEFAERVKQKLSFGKYIQADQIDQIAKEMGVEL